MKDVVYMLHFYVMYDGCNESISLIEDNLCVNHTYPIVFVTLLWISTRRR